MFKKALPIFIDGNDEELLNTHLIFEYKCKIEKGMIIRLSAFDYYKAFVDNEYLGFGPARAAKGYARIDEYDLSDFAKNEISTIRIYVAGYHCKSLSTTLQPSMFVAEVELDGNILASTGNNGFCCYRNAKRKRVCERYSVQRHFNEIYNLDEEIVPVKTSVVPTSIQYLHRNVDYPETNIVEPCYGYRKGTYYFDDAMEKARGNAWSFNPYNEMNYGVFDREIVEDRPYRFITHTAQTLTEKGTTNSVKIQENEWARFDFEQLEVGFLRLDLQVSADVDFIIAFVEHVEGDLFQFTTMNAQNTIEIHAKKNQLLNFESFEPYSFANVAIFVKSGSVQTLGIQCRHFQANMSKQIVHSFSESNIEKIYNAAIRTYAHNAVDIYTDCPSRERAGWLCDSYFTSQAEYFFFGDTKVEKNFLENFVLFENYGDYPKGIIPMVYPADEHQDFKFIPQWGMWFVLEVRDYVLKRNHPNEIDLFRTKISDFVDFLSQYENEDGLLERLPSWNFIEWSDANKWGHDVNYPTNFLYAAVLDAVCDLYGNQSYRAKAQNIRGITKLKSFNGEVFCDRAVRNEKGILENTGDVSEACQYYACLFGDVDLSLEKYAKLNYHICNRFEQYEGKLCRINAFIGLYLRMDLLHTVGYTDILKKDLYHYYLHMCDKTGTLWEYRDINVGSLDHGFASYIASILPND